LNEVYCYYKGEKKVWEGGQMKRVYLSKCHEESHPEKQVPKGLLCSGQILYSIVEIKQNFIVTYSSSALYT
jgi:hypothetical protein